MQLRHYQHKLKADTYAAWERGDRNVLAVSPTGSGKTVFFSDMIREHDGYSIAVAHRHELLVQMSMSLAYNEVRHHIYGQPATIRLAVACHMEEIGRSYYDTNAAASVAGVDTLRARQDTTLSAVLPRTTLWVGDEGHHFLRDNKWGRVVAAMPNARGLGVTAVPLRADGRGLGKHADGVFDTLIESVGMRQLINEGYLTPYRIYAPPPSIDTTNVPTSRATGDFTKPGLTAAARKSEIVGDVVAHYLRLAPGKRGITFATDVQTATNISNRYNAAGVPSAIVHAKTSDVDRIAAIRKFRQGVLLQLVNVDLFGEGVDVPAIEVVSMARPTQSYNLYCQQFGRALRPIEGKTHAIIIDHANNVMHHGLPDAPREWTLDSRDRRRGGATDSTVRACVMCTAVYERFETACPYCGHEPIPGTRDSPNQVDGDLTELDPATLARMRGEVALVDTDVNVLRAQLESERRIPLIGQVAAVNRHVDRQHAQRDLRHSMAVWAGLQRADGLSDRHSYKRFYVTFGIDALSAKALNTDDAYMLAHKIRGTMQ